MRALLLAATLLLAALAAPAAATCHFCFFQARDACQGGGDYCTTTAQASSTRDHQGAGGMMKADPKGTQELFRCYLQDDFELPVPCDTDGAVVLLPVE